MGGKPAAKTAGKTPGKTPAKKKEAAPKSKSP